MVKTTPAPGLYRALPRRGAHDGASSWFSVTRVADGYAYGYYCSSAEGKPLDRAPLVKLRVNAARTAPEGFRPKGAS